MRELRELVAFVGEAKIVHRDAALACACDHLLGLCDRNVAVVFTVYDEQRCAQRVEAMDRRKRAQERGVVPRMAVLWIGGLRDERFGMRVERLQVGHAAYVDTRSEF